MRDFLQFVVERLVDSPADVKIDESSSGNESVYQISVHPDDIGKVIGKQGRTIQAMRSLAALNNKTEQRVLIEVAESE